MQGSGLAAEAVSTFRGERLVLRDVDLRVGRGGALVLLGPNGSGKSTLLRVLAGLKRVDAGRVTWDGVDLAQGEAPIAYLGHLDGIKLGLTVAENLSLQARGRAVDAALAALDLLPLRELPARMLSAGQRRRLALARLAFAIGDGAWLLDEPTVGLDSHSIERFGALLAAHREAGGVVVTATHVALPLPGAAEMQLR